MNQNVGLRYGAMSDSISKQLRKQKLKFDKEKVSRFEKEIDAINLLRFGSNLLTDSLVDKLLTKLHKKIMEHIASANDKSVVKPTKLSKR